jgi:hypothetical protein
MLLQMLGRSLMTPQQDALRVAGRPEGAASATQRRREGNPLDGFGLMDVVDLVDEAERELDDLEAREVHEGIRAGVRDALRGPEGDSEQQQPKGRAAVTHVLLPKLRRLRPSNAARLRDNGFRLWQLFVLPKGSLAPLAPFDTAVVVSWTIRDFEDDVARPFATSLGVALPPTPRPESPTSSASPYVLSNALAWQELA